MEGVKKLLFNGHVPYRPPPAKKTGSKKIHKKRAKKYFLGGGVRAKGTCTLKVEFVFLTPSLSGSGGLPLLILIILNGK